jgi:hypothetical protein
VLDDELEVFIQLDEELLEEGANQAADDVDDEELPPRMEDIVDMSGLDRANSAPGGNHMSRNRKQIMSWTGPAASRAKVT